MIRSTDFLPKLASLSVEQRQVLTRQVLEYQANTLPALEAAPSLWDDQTTEMFDTGLKLISTLPSAHNFCLVAYQYRNIRKRLDGFYTIFLQLLNALAHTGDISHTDDDGNSAPITLVSHNSSVRQAPPAHLVIGAKFSIGSKTGKAGRPENPRNIPKIPAAGVKLENTILLNADGSDPLQPNIVQRDVKHLSDYIHLLPEDLQTEARNIKALYNAFRDYAQKYETLFFDEKATQKDLAWHAAKLDQCEQRIVNLWARIDTAYAESQGNTVSADYKHYLQEENLRINGIAKEKAPAEMTKFEIESMPDSPEKNLAKDARINRDKKFLRKDDRKGDDQHRQNLVDAATELHEWGIQITDTQAAVCRKYGYDVPPEWIELPLEERKKQQAQARNARRKAERAKAREQRQAAKAAAQAESAAPYQGDGLSLYTD